MADTDAVDRHIYDALLKISQDLSFVKGQIEGFVDHKLVAKQRLEIRVEMEAMLERNARAVIEQTSAVRHTEIGDAKTSAKDYTDGKIKELEARLAAQEERDKKRETDIRAQFVGLGVVGLAGLAYALFNMAKEAGLG